MGDSEVEDGRLCGVDELLTKVEDNEVVGEVFRLWGRTEREEKGSTLFRDG